MGTRARERRALQQGSEPTARFLTRRYNGTRRAGLHEGGVGAHGVPDVHDIPARIEVADLENRLELSAFDHRDLPRDARRQKGRLLPRARMVERPGDDDVDRAGRAAKGELFLGELAQRIRDSPAR
jgi:hypothetical protein